MKIEFSDGAGVLGVIETKRDKLRGPLVLTQIVDARVSLGMTLEQAMESLDGWSNGYVFSKKIA